MSDEKFIPCGDYLPDQPEYNNPGSNSVQNVVPRSKRSFGPMPSFAKVSTSALNGSPLGAFSVRDNSGNPGLYAGTTTKLYAATNGSKPNFVDASGATYAVPGGGAWSFAEFNGYVYASNGIDNIQSAQSATAGPFATVSTNAPKSKVIATIQPGFLLCGNINDVTVGIQPQGVRWSALGDATSWPLIGGTPAVAAASDWQPIRGDHGALQAIAPNLNSCNAALLFERAVFRMIYNGQTTIFDIQPVEKLRGTPAPQSVIQVGQVCYYLGPDGFYAFDGTVALNIGADKVNKTFFLDCDPNFVSGVRGVADPLSGLCFWAYAGTGNTNGIPNRILVFNSVLDRWSLITGFAGTCLFLALGFGTSLDGIDALGYNIDTLPFSLDSPYLAGGRLVLGAFDTTNTFGSFTGPNMAFQVETTEVQLNPRGRARVNAIRPITESDECSAAIAGRAILSDPIIFSPAVAPNAQGICPVRNEARYQRALITGPLGHVITHIQGAEFSWTPAGRR